MANENKNLHSTVKSSRVEMYLNWDDKDLYVNTPEEDEMLDYWQTKYDLAEAEYMSSRANPAKLKLWRDAYVGNFNALDSEGNPTDKKLKPIRKMAFELVEGRINSNIPDPKMSPRYHADLSPIKATEALLKHDIDKICSEQENNLAEHCVCIDGTTWFKVTWNPLDNTHERSGNPIVEVCPVDCVYPQPGVYNYRKLEYIFEKRIMTVAEIYDIYGRKVHAPDANDNLVVITAWFLNKDRYVGCFMWTEETMIVLCNDLEWGIGKVRKCTNCHQIQPIQDKCEYCGNTSFKYEPVKEEVLKEELVYIENPYRTGNTPDVSQDRMQENVEKNLPAGTEIPRYIIRQLPFVPYVHYEIPFTIYGISEVELVLEDQDIVNKELNKAERKSAKSRTVITKLKDTYIDDKDEVSYIEIDSPQEGQAIQVKQILSDITEELSMAQLSYDIAKSTTGITNTDQGKEDPTARSGKAKQLMMQASAKRNIGPDTLRNAAWSGVYELIFKNYLAYSDEERSFVSLLPDGTEAEQQWNKYMFLSMDDNGNFYYRDDYAWSVDTATEITQDRASMWQLITNDFLNGTMGTQIDPNRALLMYWQMMKQNGYPIADFAIAFLNAATEHLPTEIEQTLLKNPDAVQMALEMIKAQQEANGLTPQGEGRGGARVGAGREGNGATHAANVEKTNNRNRAASGRTTNSMATSTGGMQGGTTMNTGQQ